MAYSSARNANCDLGFKNSLETFPDCRCYDNWKADKCFSNSSPRDGLSSKSLLQMQLYLPKPRLLLQERADRTHRQKINTTANTSIIILKKAKFIAF